jgi:hypothetical protein
MNIKNIKNIETQKNKPIGGQWQNIILENSQIPKIKFFPLQISQGYKTNQ